MIQWGLFSTRLQWAAACFRDDPVFAAQVYRMTQACPSDPYEAMRALELAACWASPDEATRAAVPNLPPLPLRDSAIPDDVLDHWLEWNRHLGRYAFTVLERDGWLVLGVPAQPMIYADHQASLETDLPRLMPSAIVQVPVSRPDLLAQWGPLTPIVTQTVAVMPALTAAKLSRELPEGFRIAQVRTPAHVGDYFEVTQKAYTESYGAAAGGAARLVTNNALLGHPHVQAWIIYERGLPTRVITGFVNRGLVGAHAGAAIPEVRGRHFSECLLAHVAAWGYALGANTLCGVAMPQAAPILSRIGAETVEHYVTYRRR